MPVEQQTPSSADLPQVQQVEGKTAETETPITVWIGETFQAILEVQTPKDKAMQQSAVHNQSTKQELLKEKPRFFEQITLNSPISRDEAMQQLLAFHNKSTEKAVLDAFFNLRTYFEQTDSIVFQHSAPFNNESKGHILVREWGYISMQGFDTSGNKIWHEYINDVTGQPMMFAS